MGRANPADQALALCVDEQSQGQALERTHRRSAAGAGLCGRRDPRLFPPGATTLCAALDVLAGTVITRCKPRHRRQEFLGFLEQLDRQVPPGPDIHLLADNYGIHKPAKLKAWLARRPRYHLHFTLLRQLAQPGGALVRAYHSAGDSAWLLAQQRRAGPENRCLRGS